MKLAFSAMKARKAAESAVSRYMEGEVPVGSVTGMADLVRDELKYRGEWPSTERVATVTGIAWGIVATL